MDNWKELTLGDVAKGFARYRPFILAVLAVLLVTVALPDDKKAVEASGNFASDGGALNAGGRRPTNVAGATTPTSIDEFGNVVPVDDFGDNNGDSNPVGDEPNEVTTPTDPAAFGPDCDPTTGRVRVPINAAPPCMPWFASASNGGATAPGVTAKEIKVVYYQPQADPAVTAALTAAGANNTEPDQEATMRDYVDLFNKHFQMYGRRVAITVKHGSGKSDDDAAGRADAVDIATRIKPFAVFGSGTTNAFPAELAARKILCICTTSQPQELYEKYAPYVGYTPLMASTQGYIHRAEYVGKRLAGRKAAFAGQPLLQQSKRVFALLYYETPDNAYRSGAQFFQKELQKYGVSLAVVQSTPSDYAAAQEQSRSIIAKLRDANVTSVILSEDPISPALLTKEATRQNYFPEWILTGSALTDTSLFARTYDTAQWRHAFGISFLTARVPEEQTDAYKVHMWHFGRTPTANNQYGTIFPTPLTFALGVTMAGPNLSVASWQKGLFSFPVTGKGNIATPQISFGNHGVWPFTDYTSFDDVTEIFWDPSVIGPDELDNQGAGMYRYVAGGKRYLPGQHPTSDPKVFNNDGTVTIYDKSPDKPVPNYEHKHYYSGQ